MAMAKQGVVLHELMDRTMHLVILEGRLTPTKLRMAPSDLQIGGPGTSHGLP